MRNRSSFIHAVLSIAVTVALTAAYAPLAVAAPITAVDGDPLRLSLDRVPTVLPDSTAASLEIEYELPSEASWISVDVRLRADDKVILYRSAWKGSSAKGRSTQTVSIPLDAPSVIPGTFQIEVTATARIGWQTVRDVAIKQVSVYDPSQPRTPVVVVVRVPTVSMFEPSGNPAIDPAQRIGVLDRVMKLCDWVVADDSRHAVLALSPLTLEEWSLASGGYTLNASSDEPTVVEKTNPTAQSFDLAIAKIRQAVSTKRLELATTGYSDPDLTSLVGSGLPGDIELQYAMGLDVASSITTSTIVGAAPFRGDAPREIDAVFSRHGIRWTLISQEFAREGSESAPSGAYSLDRNPALVGLVVDTQLSDIAEAGSSNGFTSALLDRHVEKAGSPTVIEVDLDETTLPSLATTLDLLDQIPWVDTATGMTATDMSASTITLLAAPELQWPDGYWAEVTQARSRVKVLASTLAHPNETLLLQSRRMSFIAQSSAWIDHPSQADRGLNFAHEALRVANEILDGVELLVEPVTLSRATGEIPLVIRNASSVELALGLSAAGSSGLSVAEDARVQNLRLLPGENYLVIPVELANVIAGDLRITLTADSTTLAEKSVEIRGSLISRIILISIASSILVTLLVVIRRRVGSVERASGAGDHPL